MAAAPLQACNRVGRQQSGQKQCLVCQQQQAEAGCWHVSGHTAASADHTCASCLRGTTSRSHAKPQQQVVLSLASSALLLGHCTWHCGCTSCTRCSGNVLHSVHWRAGQPALASIRLRLQRSAQGLRLAKQLPALQVINPSSSTEGPPASKAQQSASRCCCSGLAGCPKLACLIRERLVWAAHPKLWAALCVRKATRLPKGSAGQGVSCGATLSDVLLHQRGVRACSRV